MKVRLVGDKIQKIEVNESLLAFLEIVGDRCGDVIVIDPLKVLYIAYESIRFNELLDKLYMLEAEICSKVVSKGINEVPDVWEKSSRVLTKSINSLNEKLLAKVKMTNEKRGAPPHEILVKATETEFEVEGFGYEEILFSEEVAEFTILEFITRIAWTLAKHEVPLNVVKTVKDKFDYYEQKCKTKEF